MIMEINVKLIGYSDPIYGNISIRLTDGNDTIGDIKTRIASQLKINSTAIRLLFGGQFLSNDYQKIGDLDLGPCTFLNALVADVEKKENGVEEIDSKSVEEKPDERHWRSRFFVYCKNNCCELTPGKLRVRCSICKSSAVLVKKEPNSWNDILTRGAIECECLENGCLSTPTSDGERSFAAVEFYFKCARCSSEVGVVPLPQVKSMRPEDGRECSICGEDREGTFMIIFSCDVHVACLNCFVSYAIEKLERRGFIMHPTYGYTLPCPEPRCRTGCISDAHHFRLLPDPELYEKYHRLAAEIYLLGEGGLYCPKVACGEAFIADVNFAHDTPGDERQNPRKFVLCPKCGWAFCFYCRAGASECQCASLDVRTRSGASIGLGAGPLSTPAGESDEAKSYVTIHWTTKSCPNCRAPTEKNEGCNHMACGQCSFDWCWDCEKRWTEDCQWNHWFD